jgi:hypothetical protein
MQMLGRKGEAEEEIPETVEEPQTGETETEDDDLPF